MTITVQEKIEQLKQKKYAYQWDMTLKATSAGANTSFDTLMITLADIFDHLSAGPSVQRPPYLGRGGKAMYAIDFSLANAWGNGLYFHFYGHSGNPRDGYHAHLWCECLGLADTRLFIEQSANVYYQSADDIVVMVEPAQLFTISFATNQPWAWQETVWQVIRDRLATIGYDDDTLALQSRVKLFETLKELNETSVFASLFPKSKALVMDHFNHPAEYDKKYFQLRSDRYIDLTETIHGLKDPGRIRTVDISYLGLSDIPADMTRFPYMKELSASGNRFVHFPEVLLSLFTLEKILLMHNHIHDIPKTIAQLQHLVFLNMSNNEIETLPDQMGLLGNLEVLHLAYNRLVRLPDSMRKLAKLRLLRLTGNPISPAEVARIQSWLPECYIDLAS